ncbi:MAG TPA: acetyl-CoA carboxylase biotin carboxyl carrier protein subunit [Ktedonobacterales bacterium]|jgi:acetyl-CoA carboxylase biotin carboxyl carrier protein|nr:acetyl-CoA carboxylase biotin carboxyl carrier protein subunit [Ktedonobacterales bacterium]
MEEHSLVSRVKALAEAMEGSDVSELELTEDGLRVVLRRRVEPTVALVPTTQAMPARNGRASRRHLESQLSSQAPQPAGIAVVAPLTGVFYISPSPSSPPFVDIGDTVQAGQVVCIVEAMKVFNEIKSEISGTVSAIVAQNGQLVQKGEALIRVQAI